MITLRYQVNISIIIVLVMKSYSSIIIPFSNFRLNDLDLRTSYFSIISDYRIISFLR